jgi:hypothetical protein
MSPNTCGSLQIYCGSLRYEPFVVVFVRNTKYRSEVQYSYFPAMKLSFLKMCRLWGVKKHLVCPSVMDIFN